MARTFRKENVNGKSTKRLKKSVNKKLRKQTKNLIHSGKFDLIDESLNAVSEFWKMDKEFI